MKIKYGYKDRSSTPIKYRFVLSTSKTGGDIYFSVLGDMCGFEINMPLALKPEIFILLGTAILINKKFIEDEVKKHLKD